MNGTLTYIADTEKIRKIKIIKQRWSFLDKSSFHLSCKVSKPVRFSESEEIQ